MSLRFPPIDYTVHMLKCGEECPHYDHRDQFCWYIWEHIKEHETCHAGIQVEHYYELIYPPETHGEPQI